MSQTHASGPPRRRRASRRKDVQRLHCEDLSHHCTLPSHNKYKYNCRTNTNTGTNTLRIQTHFAAWLCMVCPTSYVQDCLCLWNTLYLNFVFVCGTQCGFRCIFIYFYFLHQLAAEPMVQLHVSEVEQERWRDRHGRDLS